jgi:hypothetical protein
MWFSLIRSEWGQAGLAFSKCLSLLLSKMRIDLVNIAADFDVNHGILDLVSSIQPLNDILSLLASLCCCDPNGRILVPQTTKDINLHFSLPSKTGLINHLYDAVVIAEQCGYDIEHVRLLTAMLQATSRPLVNMMKDYLRNGECRNDTCNEFVVIGNEINDVPKFLKNETCVDLMHAGNELALFSGVVEGERKVDVDFFYGVDWKGAQEDTDVILKRVGDARKKRQEAAALEIKCIALDADNERERQENAVVVKDDQVELRKLDWKRKVDSFLATRDEYDIKQKEIQLEIEEKEHERDAEMDHLEQEAKDELIASYDVKMKELRKRDERITWQRKRLALSEKRIEFWDGLSDEVVSYVDFRDARGEDSSVDDLFVDALSSNVGNVSLDLREVEIIDEPSLIVDLPTVDEEESKSSEEEVSALAEQPVVEEIEAVEEIKAIETDLITPEVIGRSVAVVSALPVDSRQPKLCSSVSWLFDESVFSSEFRDERKSGPLTEHLQRDSFSHSIDGILEAHPVTDSVYLESRNLPIISQTFDKLILAQTRLIHVTILNHILHDLNVREEFNAFFEIYMMGDGYACNAYKLFLFQKPNGGNQLGLNYRGEGSIQRVELYRGMCVLCL